MVKKKYGMGRYVKFWMIKSKLKPSNILVVGIKIENTLGIIFEIVICFSDEFSKI